jgi:peptidylprolyl isomerase
MKKSLLLFCLAGSVAVQAQTAPKPATSTAKATTAHPAAAHSAAGAVKLPPGVPPVTGPVNTAFSLRYQEIKVGTGAEAVPFKIYKVFYTGYRAADGVKFDTSDDHRNPVIGKDGKPEMAADGKPKLGDPEPLAFAQGTGRLIPGFDQGFTGMHVGGKRRIFIPWQLAYGTRNIPDQPAQNGQPAHSGIPSKSDLIFDVELVDMTELPAQHPPMGAAPAPAHPGTASGSGTGQSAPAGSTAPVTPPPSSQPSQPTQTAPPPPQ